MTRLVCLLLFLATVAAGPVRAASVHEWRDDIDQMVREVEARHPAPFARVGRLTFLRQAEALKDELPRLTEEQRVVRAMRLIASIGDSHTQLQPDRPDFALWYPIRIYEFSDGYFITAAHKSVADLAGAQVIEVAGRPVAEVADAARDLVGADNAFSRKEALHAFSDAALMKGLGYAEPGGGLRIKVRLAGGRVVERVLAVSRTDDPRYEKDDATFEWHFQAEMGGPPIGTPADWISAYKGLTNQAFRIPDPSRPLRLIDRRFFTAKAAPEADAFYIQSNFVGGDFAKQFHDAMAEVDRIKPRRLIIDFRYNFGGDGSHVPAMAREFIKREGAGSWKELYILTGRRTLSAGIMAVMGVANNTDNTIIGEPMAAPVNSYGDAVPIKLTHTGLELEVSTVSHQLGEPPDIAEFSTVDVPAVFSFADYASGRDPAVDPILRGEEMRSLATIALTDGARAARQAYADRKARFAGYGWWSPPAEIVLRRVEQTLLAQKRFDDALGVAQLNAEIHPEIWNVWINLAKAQRASGQTRESLDSLRRVLEIDPNNENGGEIRKILSDAAKAPVAFTPSVLQYGASVAAMQGRLAPACPTMRTRRIDPPFLSSVKREQIQIDCDGFDFRGAQRHAEFVFRDGELVMAWVMLRPDEDGATEEAMTAAFGPPRERSARYLVFAKGGTALRLDKHEILFYGPALAEEVETWFAEARASGGR